MDDFTQSVKDLTAKLSIGVRRTAAVTKLRVQLTGLDRQRNEIYQRLGSRVDELRQTGQLNDRALLMLLELEFSDIDRVESRIRETMDQIQELSLQERAEVYDYNDVNEAPAPEKKNQNLLDSFDVI